MGLIMGNDDYEEDDIDDFINELVEIGMLIEHLDEKTGETLYQIAPEAKDRMPGLWDVHVEDMKQSMYRLFMAGVVTMMFSEEGDMYDTVALTEQAFDPAVVATLDYFDQKYLEHLINVFEENI
jgi:hypothetical protein